METVLESIDTPQTGWLVFNVVSIGANIQLGDKTNQRTLWAKLEPPQHQPVRVAIEQYPGAGPKPENTLGLVELGDILYSTEKSVYEALQRKLDTPQGGW